MNLSNPQLERSYLQLVLDMPEALDAGVSPEHMTEAINRATHAAMIAVRMRGEPLDTVTVGHELERRGFDRGSVAQQFDAIRQAPLVSAKAASQVLRGLHEQRSLYEQATLGASLAVEAKVDEARDVLARAAFGATSALEVFSIRQAVESAFVEFERVVNAQQTSYLRLGLCETLDNLLTVGPGDTVIIAAETNTGKSSLVFSSVASLETRGIASGLVSIEDPKEDWGAKALGHFGEMNTTAFWAGKVSRDEWLQATNAVNQITSRPQHARMAVAKSGTLEEVCQAMSVLVRVHGARILFVDYIQAIQHAMKGATRKQEVDTVYRRLQATARLLGVPLVLTSQLSRGEDDNREPTVKRLKESGDLENGAQVIMLVWVDKRDAESNGWASAPVRLKVAKLKRAPERPRVMFTRGPGGVLHEVEWREPVGKSSMFT